MNSPIKYFGGKSYMVGTLLSFFPFDFKSQNAESSAIETLWYNYDIDQQSGKKKLW